MEHILPNLSNDNSQKEIYLTEAISKLAVTMHLQVSDPKEVSGINNKKQMSECEKILQERIRNNLMEEESINLEIEQLPWYVELEGKKNEWNLRLIFESSEQTRSFEMYWPIPIAENLFNEIKIMWESMD